MNRAGSGRRTVVKESSWGIQSRLGSLSAYLSMKYTKGPVWALEMEMKILSLVENSSKCFPRTGMALNFRSATNTNAIDDKNRQIENVSTRLNFLT